MKKVIIIVVCVVIGLVIIGSLLPETESAPDKATTTTASEKSTISTEEPTTGTTQGEVTENLGKQEIEIISCELSQDIQKKDVAIITYRWKNNSDEALDFMLTFNIDVFQSGIECESAYFVDGVELSDITKKIKPGNEIEVKQAYLLNDKSKIEIEISELISFGSEKITKEIELS